MMYVIIFWLLGIFMIGALLYCGISAIIIEIESKKRVKARLRKEQFNHIMSITTLKELE